MAIPQGQPDGGGAEFFICYRPLPHLDGVHTVFGRVIDGLDVACRLRRRDPNQPDAPPGDVIHQATVLRKRDHEYVPRKVGDVPPQDAATTP
jgi:cyclophilin family peptidyl-prolyl cis-trans isomerase